MDSKRYVEIRKSARAKIAQREKQSSSHLTESSDTEFIKFDSPDALMEALRKGE